MKKAYLTIQHGPDNILGALYLNLYDDTVPRTVANFVTLLENRDQDGGYVGCSFHRVIKGFMAQGGDIVAGDGTGSTSIYGTAFDDENFIHIHDRPGMLSMANAGANTNGSQFFVTFKPTPQLDGRHVVFGHVDLERSRAVLRAMEQVAVTPGTDHRPKQPVTIVDGGLIVEKPKEQRQQKMSATATTDTAAAPVDDADEIDLDEEEDDEEDEKDDVAAKGKDTTTQQQQSEEGAVETTATTAAAAPQQDADAEEEEDTSATTTTTKPAAASGSKSDAIKQRIRALKQKMNQARQLNRQAVQEEGERKSHAGSSQQQKRAHMAKKQAATETFLQQNAKAVATSKAVGVDAKYLTEQAQDSLGKAHRRAEKAALNAFSINDYHNPEGQYRNYERNLRSLPADGAAAAAASAASSATTTYDPLDNVDGGGSAEQERLGARRVATELHRRNEKRRQREDKKRAREEADDDNVSSINQRNKRFNEKINRTYDKQTAEIRQNLERGTAL